MSQPRVAWIDPQRCIGCARCIEACPFDAIIGVAQRNHLVLPDWCTECALCLPVCPVDCILWREDAAHPNRDHAYRMQARERAIARRERLGSSRFAQKQQLEDAHEQFRRSDGAARRQAIAAAVARTRRADS